MTNQQRLEALIAAERAKKARERSEYLIAYAQTQKLLASLMQRQK